VYVLKPVLGEQTLGELLDFVVAVVELEGLGELVDEAATDLQVLEDREDGPDFGVGIELDAAEALDDLSMVGAGADFGVEIASCTVTGWTALGAEHTKQVVQILASCSGTLLAMEVADIADTPAGIGHTVDTAACKGCFQGAAAGSTVSIGAAVAGKSAELLEFVKQNLMQLPLLLLMQNLLQLWLYLKMAGLWL
jgi:hypothetical protein